jgi:hypothetical protein
LSFYKYFLQLNKPTGFYVIWLLAIIVGIAVGLYHPADFHYHLMFQVNELYAGGLPFKLEINCAKVLAGFLILCFLYHQNNPRHAYVQQVLAQIFLIVSLALLVLLVAFFVLDLHLYLKPLMYILMFSVENLLATCIVEEAFMRLLLQAQVQLFTMRFTKSKWLIELIPLAFASAVFVLTHLVTQGPMLVVFSLAGIVYGAVYSLTKNIVACVCVHFLVNVILFNLSHKVKGRIPVLSCCGCTLM